MLSLSLVIIGLDNTVLNVALPTLQEEFDASTSTLQWMVDSYLLVFAGLLLTLGTLGDRFGRKRALQAGLVIFGGASLAGSTSDSATADRGPGGDGHRRRADHAGDALDHDQRLPARGARQGDRHLVRHGRRSASGSARCSAALLLEWFSWRRCSSSMSRSPSRSLRSVGGSCPKAGTRARPHRRAGAAALHRRARLLVYAIIEAPEPGWLDPRIARLLRPRGARRRVRLLGAAHARPDARLGFFRNPRFCVALGAIGLTFFALFGSIFVLTQYLQFVQGTPRSKPAPLVPLAIGLMIGAGVEPQPRQELGTSAVVAAGLLVVGGLLATILLWTPDMPTG